MILNDPSHQTEKLYFAQEIFFPLEKCADKLDISSQNSYRKPGFLAVRKRFSVKYGDQKSPLFLVHKGILCRFLRNELLSQFEEFAQIFIIARIFALEINFLQN